MRGKLAQDAVDRIADRWIKGYGSFSPSDMTKEQRIECWAHLARHDDNVCRFLAIASDSDLDNVESWIQTKIAFQKRQVDAACEELFRRSYPEKRKSAMSKRAAWIVLAIAIAAFFAFADDTPNTKGVESHFTGARR